MTLPKELVLTQPREFKIELLEKLSKARDFMVWAEFSTILLDAPISKGGIETDVIKNIWDKHNKPIK